MLLVACFCRINQRIKKEGIRIVWIDSEPLSCGFHYCNVGYIIPKGDNPRFLKKILKICDIEKINAIISKPIIKEIIDTYFV